MSNSAFTPSVLTISAPSTGSGQGELNVISNPSAVTDLSGWTATGLTPSRDTSGSPLDPTVPTGFSLSTSASGQTYVSTVTVPSSLRNRKLKLEFYFSQSTSSYKVDVLNSSSVRFPLTTDVSSVSNIPAISGGSKYTTYFDMDSGSTISVRFSSIASSGVLKFTQLIVGPGIQPQGAVIGEPQAYSPTVSNITNINTQFWWQRIGSNIRIWGGFNTTAAPGGTGNININLLGVLNLTADLTKIKDQIRPSVTTQDSGLGYAYASYYLDTSTSNPLGQVRLVAGSSTTVEITSTVGTAGIWSRGSNIPGTWGYFTNANLDNLFLDVTIPIAEWAGSGTVQLAQNDVEWAWNSSTSTTSDTTSFGYGPQGALIRDFAPTTVSSIDKRVRFQTPIQPGDVLVLETDEGSSGARWVPLVSRLGAFGYDAATPTFAFGTMVNQVTGSATDVDVRFFSKITIQSTNTWSQVNTWRWRLRKSSAGAAVGFGVVQPGVSSGLVSASGLPGNTTGSAIAAGYVGEVLTATWTGQTITGAATTLGTISNVQPGIYIVMAKCDGSKGTSTRTVGTYGGTSTYIESGAGFGGVEYLQAQDTTSIQANFSTTIRVTAAGTFTFVSQVITGTSNVTSARGCLILVRIA